MSEFAVKGNNHRFKEKLLLQRKHNITVLEINMNCIIKLQFTQEELYMI